MDALFSQRAAMDWIGVQGERVARTRHPQLELKNYS